ncbi:MAG TPA: protein-S-isoprenylcysteine O-methyltransferase [Anaerolineales bacterium]|nr:protein-S-isoprenylcysteine O-methyltransferase [Anaerolineales bacterium]HNN12976.1 protein-S-isoprenylcysteine O-methyltransferase [Anaerolineales bacterium]HNO32554.1 protein-S-isoprenylcysteine O-methyltransferase [Anaerolineales bacterium]
MNLFEIVFWLAMVAEMVIRAPINKKRKAEAMSRQQVTRQEKTLLVLLLLGMFIFPLVYSATSWLDFANYSLPTWAGWTGVLVMAGAIFVFWRSHADLGLNWSPSLEIREKHELITRGIYGLIRHPMYASQWLWVIAQPLLLQNWLAGFANLILFIPFYILRVQAEEQMMLETFGASYQEYMQKTGRVFPKIGGNL